MNAGVVGGDLVAGFACISVCKDRFIYFDLFFVNIATSSLSSLGDAVRLACR